MVLSGVGISDWSVILLLLLLLFFFFFQAEDGIRDIGVTGVQTCALPISKSSYHLPFCPDSEPDASHCWYACGMAWPGCQNKVCNN